MFELTRFSVVVLDGNGWLRGCGDLEVAAPWTGH